MFHQAFWRSKMEHKFLQNLKAFHLGVNMPHIKLNIFLYPGREFKKKYIAGQKIINIFNITKHTAILEITYSVLNMLYILE